MDALGGEEEMERALMDLGPLLGVAIKEEVSEDGAAAPAPAPTTANSGEAADGGAGALEGATEGGGAGADAADSLESPGRAAPAAARCVLCGAALAGAEGTPRLMECLHSACEPCVKAKVEEKLASSSSRDFLGAERVTITCPVCRFQCQPANMIDQRFVLEKNATDAPGSGAPMGDQQCNSCEDSEPATSFCVECGEFICDSCVRAHQRLKITKDHTIRSKDDALADMHAAASQAGSGPDMFCREHPQERLSLFCETCDRLTCRDCQLQHHRDHKYQFSTEMAAQARASISALLSEVSYKRVLLGSAMKVIRERQALIADKKKALVHEITQVVVKLTNAINTRGKQLVLRLNEVCSGKLRTLAEKRDALTQLAATTDHCLEFVTQALEQGSDTALLYSKRLVSTHLQRIKSRRADIPNPEIPVRISLALDPLPDLLRVLSTIGAIVVDGKVDGGAGVGGGGGGGGGGAQGPYCPPAPAAAPHAPHSAVAALQHAAMHQSYVQSGAGGYMAAGGGGGGAGGAGAGLRARHATPLRHPHVTSTTHPHHLHGMNELNLRGLLTPLGRGRGAAHPSHPTHPAHPAHPAAAQQAMQHAYQQMLGAYANSYASHSAGGGGGGGGGAGAAGGGGGSGRRSGGPRTPSPAPPPLYSAGAHYQHPKWHIPQHQPQGGVCDPGLAGNGSGLDFKITLARQGAAGGGGGGGGGGSGQRQPALVTSTNPKTPSPSLHGGVPLELDKVCAESVQDLMATIAKLDSNGVQVVAEPPALAAASAGPAPGPGPAPAGATPAPSPAPAVHSSTDSADAGKPLTSALQSGGGGGGASDPNEDWCAVCMDGGELMCCDKCPKVFHQYCHIPTIDKLPDETETWQCLLCVNFAELPPDDGVGDGVGAGLTPRQQKIVERITLELYCQYEPSLPFREPVPIDNLHYHAKIQRPMCLDAIRAKLQPGAAERYARLDHFVSDCRLVFHNAYLYNPPDSQIYKDAKRLEDFFNAQVEKWLPELCSGSSGGSGGWAAFGEPVAKRPRP